MQIYLEKATDVIHKTKVDLVQRPAGNIVNLTQYDDTLPILKVELFNNGKSFVLPNNVSVFIRYSKPDGEYCYNGALGMSEDGKFVYFTLTYQMTTNIGKAIAVIEFIFGESRSSSSPIQFSINKNPIQSNDIESQVELGIVESLLRQSEFAVLQAQQARDRCEEIYNEIINMVGGGYVTLATQQHITGRKTIDYLDINNLLTFNQGSRFHGDFIPDANSIYDIGNSAYRINVIYGNKIVLGRYELDEAKLGKLLELLEVLIVEEET